jgi:hypothetical protein
VAVSIVAVNLIPEREPVDDKRLGRHVEHDVRSRDFPAVAKVTPPKSVTWRHHGRVLNQGNLGSCTGNAMTDALMCDPLWQKGQTLTEHDAVALYELATKLDGIPGVYPPDDTGSSGLAVAKAAVAEGWITGYSHAFGLDQALAALQAGPVIIGVNWHSDMDNPGPGGVVHVGGTIRGGHEVCVVGCDADKKTVRVLNSWGPHWGDKGYFTLSWADFGRLLNEQGDVTVPRPSVAAKATPQSSSGGSAMQLSKYAKAVWAFAGSCIGAVTVAVAALPPGHQHIGEVSDLGWLVAAGSVLGITTGVAAVTNKAAKKS